MIFFVVIYKITSKFYFIFLLIPFHTFAYTPPYILLSLNLYVGNIKKEIYFRFRQSAIEVVIISISILFI